ncbi:oxidoreductase [Photobacterium aquae]|uniref:Oxidoreductase n=1 Tax=Photobacterium aquae TaxID=1195763 RepID=A0A0J1JPF8_9GAMM|nr:SDR family NAD(P)-dependent oxidoreductase [Photobacterium aquae]KLV04112.1 oxidoreductase [Photobacterium aquae]
MPKTILITGATDGIGLETAKQLVSDGHLVILHGRNPTKLADVEKALSAIGNSSQIETIVADLSQLQDVNNMIKEITQRFGTIDVLINNAGVFNIPAPRTDDGLDSRFAVNTYAPFLLTRELLPLLGEGGRVINLSSAAQASVDLKALSHFQPMADGDAYAQSKLALTMWSRLMGEALKQHGPMVVAVNPKSLLGSKMVKDAFGITGGDIKDGADILVRAALSDEFADAGGKYFDNDIGQFGDPHADALDDRKALEVVSAIEAKLDSLIN